MLVSLLYASAFGPSRHGKILLAFQHGVIGQRSPQWHWRRAQCTRNTRGIEREDIGVHRAKPEKEGCGRTQSQYFVVRYITSISTSISSTHSVIPSGSPTFFGIEQ